MLTTKSSIFAPGSLYITGYSNQELLNEVTGIDKVNFILEVLQI